MHMAVLTREFPELDEQAFSTILCIDDRMANFWLLKSSIIPRGYDVVWVANGKDAMVKVRSQTIDLVPRAERTMGGKKTW